MTAPATYARQAPQATGRVLHLGIVGLGGAAVQMLPSLLAHPAVRITAVADLAQATRERFAADHGATAYETVDDLCRDPSVDAVYVATPHALHAEQTILAARRGKHVLVEKPMALTLEECRAMREAGEQAGVHVVVGHTHAFDRPVLALREMIRSGEFGPLAMVNTWSFGDFLYRPRRPEELDTRRGGGILFNQLPHQVDVVRFLAGGCVRKVRSAVWSLDPGRPTEDSHVTFLDFEDGVAASLVYSGRDFFDTDEFHGWVGENGEPKVPDRHGSARRALRGTVDEVAAKAGRGYRGTPPAPPAEVVERRGHPHAGILVASCARADLRLSPHGIVVYEEAGAREVRVPLGPTYPDKTPVVDEFYAAAALGRRPLHDAAWGEATMEVCLAVAASARERREMALCLQSPLGDDLCLSPPGGDDPRR